MSLEQEKDVSYVLANEAGTEWSLTLGAQLPRGLLGLSLRFKYLEYMVASTGRQPHRSLDGRRSQADPMERRCSPVLQLQHALRMMPLQANLFGTAGLGTAEPSVVVASCNWHRHIPDRVSGGRRSQVTS